MSPLREVALAAERILAAATTRRQCPPIRELIGADNVESAYAVQRIVNAARVKAGARPSGRKVGLTSPVVQKQLGVNQPDFGVLFADTAYTSGARISMRDLFQPKVEAEVAFVLASDLADGPLDAAQVRAAIGHAVPAIEVVDSRIANWDIRLADTVADNASYAGYVLGATQRRLGEGGFQPIDVEMRMTLDGKEVSTGNGSNCLGDPINAVTWLARTARDLGDPLRAGFVVISGSLGPVVPVQAGSQVEVELSGLGTVSAAFVA